MMISGAYRELVTPEERQSARALAGAWKSPLLPERQWSANRAERDVLGEPAGYARVAPFRAFGEALAMTDLPRASAAVRILDVGCASGYYHEVLRAAGFAWTYVGVDYSEAFRDFAAQVLPHVTVEVGDACALPYPARSFDVVVSGGCLLHIEDWRAAVAEVARVSGRYAVFHRTPLLAAKATTHWLKEAYGVPCFEIWFNRAEFLEEVARAGLVPAGSATVFETAELGGYGHYSLVFARRR
jgi:SAM-dependent methyltransferase